MCMIIAKPKNTKLPNKKTLWHCYKYNSDGIGVMYVKSDSKLININKDFKDFKAFYKFLLDNVTADDIAVIHFRYATSGKRDKGNSHPFPISTNKKRLRQLKLKCKQGIAHNGVISEYSNNSKYSDTQQFIFNVLAKSCIKHNLKSKPIQKLIEKYINGDRLAILDENNLILIGEFYKENGLYFSNFNYIPDDNKKQKYNDNTYNQYYGYCDCCDKQELLNVFYEDKKTKYYLCDKCLSYINS